MPTMLLSQQTDLLRRLADQIDAELAVALFRDHERVEDQLGTELDAVIERLHTASSWLASDLATPLAEWRLLGAPRNPTSVEN